MSGQGERATGPIRPEDVLRTEAMSRRPSRPRELERENSALRLLAAELASDPAGLLARLTDVVLDLCRAESAGICVRESSQDSRSVRWIAAAGILEAISGRVMACTLHLMNLANERDDVLLLDRPGRCFSELTSMNPPMLESLLAPLRVEGRTVGAVWAISHDPEHRFDAEDARLLQGLARFASAGCRVIAATQIADKDVDRFGRCTADQTTGLRGIDESTGHEVRTQRKAEETPPRARTLAEETLETVRESMLVLDTALRVKSANAAFFETFRVRPEEIEGRLVYELGDGQWNIPRLRELLESVLPTNRSFNDYDVEHDFEGIGRRTMRLNARRIDRLQLILLAIEDVTQRRRAEEARREAEARYRTLFDTIDEGFCIVEVLFDDAGEPTDYRFLEVNPAFERQTGIANAVGRRMRELAPAHEDHWARTYARVARTGESVRFEAASEALGRHYDVFAFPVGRPEQRRVGVLFNDITQRKRTEEALRIRSEQFETLLNRAPIGVYLVDADFRVRQINPVAEPVFGAPPGGVIGRDFEEVVRLLWMEPFADEIVRVFRHTLETGEPYQAYEQAEVRADRGVAEYYQWRVERITLPDGRHGAVCYFQDVSEQVSARRAIAESEERYRMVVAQVKDHAIFHIDVEGRVTSWNEGCRRVFGYERDEIIGMDGSLLFVPEDRAAGIPQAELREAVRTGRAGNDRWMMAKGGRRFFAAGATTSLRGSDGELRGFSKVLRDETEWKRAEEALRESEEQFRRAIEDAPIPVIMHAEDGEVLQINRAWTELTGYTIDDVRPIQDWLTQAYGEGGEDLRKAVRRLFEPGSAGLRNVEFDIVTRDGRPRVWSFSASSPGVLRDGRRFVVAMAEDITDRKRHDDQMRMIMAELNHRVKNTLAAVEAMASQTMQSTESPRDFVVTFGGRLRSMSKAHALLTRTNWTGASLRDLLQTVLESRLASPDQARLEGPPLVLHPKPALALHMVFHELATNAAKYGALSSAAGRLAVRWNVDGTDDDPSIVALEWIESNGPPVQPPTREGFGTRLLRRTLNYELDGNVNLEFRREGLRCRIEFPCGRMCRME